MTRLAKSGSTSLFFIWVTKIIIADGVDQFVRGVDQINWREGVIESQIVPLRKSLRLSQFV